MVGGGPNALRTVAIAISTLAGLALLFGLLFIQVRDAGLVHMRQLNYGELERVQHQLRDWVDVLRVRVERNTTSATAIATVVKPYSIEEVVPPTEENTGAERLTVDLWCGPLVSPDAPADGRFALEFDGTQRRDDRVMLAHGLAKAPTTDAATAKAGSTDDKTKPKIAAAQACSRTDMTPILAGGDGRFSPDDLAIARADGRVLLVLRGDAAWPAETSLPLSASDPAAQARPGTPLIKPVAIELGGEKFDLYAVPLDLGRSIRVGGENGADCAPRQCMLVALGHRAGVAESLRDLSPIVRTSFAALAMLVLLLVPLLKLRTIDQNGAMHWVEVAALIATVPLAIAAVTLLLTVQGDWVWQRLKQDSAAAAQAQQLAKELDAEVAVSLREATELAKCLRDGDRNHQAKDKKLRCKGRETGQTLPLRSLSVRTLKDSTWTRVIKLSDFDVAPKVEDRDYFRRLKSDDDLVPLGKSWSYVTAQVPDIYQNKSLLVVGLLPDPGYCKSVDTPGCVLLGVKPLASTLQRPMPPGFGFAVIDPKSLEVLQHSDPTQQHSQHFDEQITRTGWLDSLARSMPVRCRGNGKAEAAEQLPPAEVLYRGETVRMTLTPACVPRWIVATWYSRTHEQRAVTLAARFAGAFAVLVLAVVALVALGAGVLSRDRLIVTIWPMPEVLTANGEVRESGRANRDLQAGLPVLAAYLMVLLKLFEGDNRLLLAVAIVILTALAFYRAYYLSTSNDSPVVVLARAQWPILVLSIGFVLVAGRWAGDGWLAAAAITLGGVLAWHIRPVGRRVGAIWSSLRKRLGKGAGKAEPSARSVESIARKTRPVRTVQLWAMVLLAVLAPLAAYGAATDATEGAAARRYASEATLAREKAGRDICAVLQHYNFDKEACAAVDVKVIAKRGGYNRFWPAKTERELPSSSSPYRRNWAGVGGVEAILRQVTSPDEFADFTAARLNGRSHQVRDDDAADRPAVAEATPSATGIALMLAVVLVLALALAGFVLGLLGLLNQGLFGLHHFEFRSLHPQMPADSLAKTLETVGMRRVLFIDFPLKEFDDLCQRLDSEGGFEMLHLGQLRDETEDRPTESFGRKPWVIRGFESIISSGELRRKALHLLERLTSQREVEIYFFIYFIALILDFYCTHILSNSIKNASLLIHYRLIRCFILIVPFIRIA